MNAFGVPRTPHAPLVALNKQITQMSVELSSRSKNFAASTRFNLLIKFLRITSCTLGVGKRKKPNFMFLIWCQRKCRQTIGNAQFCMPCALVFPLGWKLFAPILSVQTYMHSTRTHKALH